MLHFRSGNRFRAAAITAIVLVAGGFGARYYALHRPVKVGEFAVPSPLGWTQTVVARPNNSSFSVFYKKDNLWIALSWKAANNPPETVRDLRDAQKQREKDLAALPKSSRMSVEPLIDKITSFNGMTARFVKDIARTPFVLHRQTYAIIHGDNHYELAGIITHPANSSISLKQQAEFDQAWKQISDAMKL